jgi:ergothioneine biosynthesis protein EgtB
MVSTLKASEPAKLPIIDLYRSVRARTMQIVAPLETEDYVIQTAEFMSPPRWHIGHTSWFFETLLQAYQPEYRIFSEDYLFYFNSYYEGFGARIQRPKRGTKSRPTVKDTVVYRQHIDEHMLRLLESLDDHLTSKTVFELVRLGLEHEMQHQELLVYDIKHLLCDQFGAPIKPAPTTTLKVEGMAEIEGGLFWLGHGTWAGSPTVKEDSSGFSLDEFAFDNEKPAHQVFMQDFAIDRALVSNGDFLEFIQDGGYQNFRWWFSEGWEVVNREQWGAPLYWELQMATGRFAILRVCILLRIKQMNLFVTSATTKLPHSPNGLESVCQQRPSGKRPRPLILMAHVRISPGATMRPAYPKLICLKMDYGRQPPSVHFPRA